MNDRVLNVRQIAQYPLANTIAPADVMLMQQGGLGGRYVSVPAFNLFAGGFDTVAVGLRPPPAARGVLSSFLITPLGARQGFNWYVDAGGFQRYLQNGVAGQWSFADGELSFAIAPVGFKDNTILPGDFCSLLALGYDGNLKVAQTLGVGRGPVRDNEVVPKIYLEKNSVASFNKRIGAVTLTPADLNAALDLQEGDGVASQFWVDETICRAINDWYDTNPFVFTFNGRVGDICLTATDVSKALFADPPGATAPTPPWGDATNRIATTSFVDLSIMEVQHLLEQEIANSQYIIINDYLDLYAPLESPVLTGHPQAPTAPVGTSTGQIATTAFVMNQVAESVAGVASFNTRTGNVTLEQQDIIDAGGWVSPILTGNPMAPTPSPGAANGEIATCAWVLAEIAAMTAGVSSFNTRTGAVTLQASDLTGAGGALTASPAFTGTPSAPTPTTGAAGTQIATVAFVTANAGVSAFNGRTGNVNLTSADVSGAGGALIASPIFIGTPTAPTAVPGTSSTQLATTAFVAAAVAAAGGVSTFNTRAGAVTLQAADVIATQYVGAGFINKFYNGGFSVAQRGVSGTIAQGAGVYTVDGWIVNPTTGNYSWNQVFNGGFFRGFALRLTSVPAGEVRVISRIESMDVAQLFAPNGAAQAVTVQFKIYNGGVAGAGITPTIIGYTPNATDGFSSGQTQQFTATFPTVIAPGATATLAYTFMLTGAMLAGLAITLDLPTTLGAGGYVDIAEADIRATPWAAVGWNSSPPPVELRTQGEAVARCYRYYQTYANLSYAYFVNGGSGWWTPLTIPPMRTTPSVASQFSVTNIDQYGAVAQSNNNLRIDGWNSATSTPVSFGVSLQLSAEL